MASNGPPPSFAVLAGQQQPPQQQHPQHPQHPPQYYQQPPLPQGTIYAQGNHPQQQQLPPPHQMTRQGQQQQYQHPGYPPHTQQQQNQHPQQQQNITPQQQHQQPQNMTQQQQQQQQNMTPQTQQTTPTPSVVATPPVRKMKASLEDTVLIPSAPDDFSEDGRSYNREAVAKIRDTWMYKQVRVRQHEFTQFRQATLFVGTWNVNAKGKEESLEQWICADWGANHEFAPDLVAVGFQEIVDLNAVNVAVDNKTTQRSNFWCDRLVQTLNARSNSSSQQQHASSPHYVMMLQKSLVGLLVCVFCKQAHAPRVKYVNSASVGVGVMGMMGNKGGVSIRLQFYDSTLVFVCSHLAAHTVNVVGRNQDFANVFTKTTFEIGEEAIREVIRSGSLSHWAIGSSSVGIRDHDLVFWLGDLNYRIDESMMTEKVLHLSEKGILNELRVLDQLNVERAAGRVFEGFEEGVLNFPPTYKYQPSTDLYEKRPDKKLRAPAWCDRILWMAQEPEHVQQVTYRRSERPNFSDHKAVYSTFRITIKDVIQQKREAIYTELMKLLDRFENQTLPMVGLDRVNLDFGEVRYGQTVSLPITITNTGSVVAQFRLVPKLDEKTVCKSWMKVSPAYGMLIPGDEPATLTCYVEINNTTAQMLNSGREVLDDILILRLENGRDYYITVKATYARSCFGMPAEELVMYSEPIRTIPLDAIQRAEVIDPRTTTALCVPKELWRLIDAVSELGLFTEHLFINPGIADEVSSIRECLDTGAQFGQYRIHSYAEVLVTFLESLSVPIVPNQLFPNQEIDSLNIQSSARRLLEELPPVHYNIFVYVISFFREVLVYRERNLLSAAKVARVCCTCLAPGKGLDTSTTSLHKRTSMQLVVLHLLETSSI